MVSFGHRLGFGLDIGASGIKALLLDDSGAGPEVLAGATQHTREEGILTERELYASLSGWLENLGWLGHGVTVGLPQYLATTQVSDFPPGAGASLEDMVAYETQQLAGLSEESFIHDFHVMSPGSGRRNPVLIGICRESVIRERLGALQGGGVRVVDVAMNGLAAVNALLHLHPEAGGAALPQVVLELGHENGTLVVVQAGQPLFVASLQFGAERFTRAYVEKRHVSIKDAEQQKRQIDLLAESPASPMTLTLRALVAEIRNALEHWQAQEDAAEDGVNLAGLWLCGGGALQPGLTQVLAEEFACPTQVFGPVVEPGGAADPTMSVALGLALQGVGRAHAAVSLAPPELRWQVARVQRFAVLATACVLLGLLACGMVFRAHRTARRHGEDLRQRMGDLQRCETLIPRLEAVMQALAYHEARIIPLVEKGNRGRRFSSAIEDLAAACAAEDWFVYLADAESYQRGKLGDRGEKADTLSAPGTFPGAAAGRSPGIGDTVSVPEFQVRQRVGEMAPMRALIVGGYTPLVPTQLYERVRDIVSRLDQSDRYRGVDLMPESERVGREDIFLPWMAFFRSVPAGPYKAFTLVMPFSKLDVSPTGPRQEAP